MMQAPTLVSRNGLTFDKNIGHHVLPAPVNTITYGPSHSVSLEWFSNECRKTKTKAITLTNHNRNKTQNEPIRNQIKYKQLALSAGKRVRASHDWFWFYA